LDTISTLFDAIGHYFDTTSTILDTTRQHLDTIRSKANLKYVPIVENIRYALEESMKRNRAEGSQRLYPRPGEWRKQLRTFEENLIAQQQKWIVDDAKPTKAKPKILISLPGAKKTAFEIKMEIASQHAKGTLKSKRSEFFACSSCRWTVSGEGCYKCNPAKAEEVKEKRAKQASQLQKSLAAYLEKVSESLPTDLAADEVNVATDLEKMSETGATCIAADEVHVATETSSADAEANPAEEHKEHKQLEGGGICLAFPTRDEQYDVGFVGRTIQQ